MIGEMMGLSSMIPGVAPEAGAALGPIGALAGAGLSAGGSLFDSFGKKKEQKKQQKEQEEATQSLPGHKKASRVYDSLKDAMQSRWQSMAALSQAAMDWAQLMR